MNKKEEYFYDLHCHSLSSADSPTRIEDAVRMAQKRGLNGIAITDHNKTYRGPTLIGGIEIIPGSEIILKGGGHLLGYFIKEDLPSGLKLEEAVSMIKKQGGYAVLAHPFREDHGYFRNLSEKEKGLSLVDGLEAANASDSNEVNNLACRLAEDHPNIPLFLTSASDAHMAGQIGFGAVKVNEKLSRENFARVLRKAELIVVPESRAFGKQVHFLRRIFSAIEKPLNHRWLGGIKKVFYSLFLRNALRFKNRELSRIEFNLKNSYNLLKK